MSALGLLPLEGAPHFGTQNFESRPLFPGVSWLGWLTNDSFQAIVGALLVVLFWVWVSRKPRVVPGKRQFLGEYAYELVRNSIARDMIGPEYKRFVPYLLALFSFILVNNLFGEFFLFMFPTFSKIGYVYGLALLSFILYNAVGIKKHGFGRYFKNSVLPSGVPPFLWPLVIPLEFVSNFVTRPVTLALRLFANLMAGHLVVGVFVVGGGWLLTQLDKPVWVTAGAVAVIFSFAIFALELLVAALQAYIFTVLTAQYVSSALADGH